MLFVHNKRHLLTDLRNLLYLLKNIASSVLVKYSMSWHISYRQLVKF